MTGTGRSIRPGRPARPTRDDLASARGRTIPDILGPGLRVLFCGINPSLYSGATGHHFARPGNRFWPALYRSGFTARQLRPDEGDELLRHGLGITNLVGRATATAAELASEELRLGGQRLASLVRQLGPDAVAVVGINGRERSWDGSRNRSRERCSGSFPIPAA
jgi:TDG/mug DNA glycosylase family protein